MIVNQKIAEGYLRQGGIAIYGNCYSQTMMLK